MSRTALGEFEHYVLLALIRLGGKSHGPPVVLALEQATGRSVSPAAVFIALRRLEERGYAKSAKQEPRPGEGGRGRRVFQVTPAGQARLRQAQEVFERLWRGRDPEPEVS